MTRQDAELVAHLAREDGYKRVEIKTRKGGDVVSLTDPATRSRVTFRTPEEFYAWHAGNVEKEKPCQ